MPHVIVIAGPNGAGKTTAAPALLDKELNIGHFVNADTIAAGLSAFSPETVAFAAGRAMLSRMHDLAYANEDFAFETTLASRSFAPWIIGLAQKGYLFNLIFLVLDRPDLAVFRVTERVKTGGHFVPDETVRRRYKSGLHNFFNLYAPIANSWQMYDNSSIDMLSMIAEKKDNEILIYKSALWQSLVAKYDKSG